MKNKFNVLLIQPTMPESVDKEYVSTQLPINLAYIAASLEQVGANVKIIDFCVEKFLKEKFLNLLSEFKPKIIGFTSMTPTIDFVKQTSKLIKEKFPETTVVLGGIHMSALPERTMEELPFIDLGIVGEGEETIKEIYDSFLNEKPMKEVKGVVLRDNKIIKRSLPRELIKNIDTIPFPARHLLKMDKYLKSHVSRGFSRKHLTIMELITSRGCPNQCIFCAGHINYGCSLRFRSYENIISEIELLRKEYGVNHISIEDDTFTLNKELVKKLCEYFRKNKITWNCNARVNTINLEILKIMKKSGCKKISFGVESGSPEVLKLIKKGITLEQVRNAFKWAKQSGIRYVEGTFILGSHPDEKMSDILKTEKIIFELMPDFISVSIICPFPGTEVYNIMEKEGLLDEDLDWSKLTFINNTPPFKRLKHVTAEQLVKKQREILKKYYSSPKYIFNQVRKIRTFDEITYFLNLGKNFISEFIFKRK